MQHLVMKKAQFAVAVKETGTVLCLRNNRPSASSWLGYYCGMTHNPDDFEIIEVTVTVVRT